MVHTIALAVVIGTLVSIFSKYFWRPLKFILRFLMVILVAPILYMQKDFKNHRFGYILIVLVIVFLAFGFYMGVNAGHSYSS